MTFRAAAVGVALAAMAYGLVAPGAPQAARAGQVPLPADDATAVASGPIVSAGVPGGCVDDYQVATYNGAPVDVWPCNGGQAQIWTLMTDGTIRINGMCLTQGAAKPDPANPSAGYITLALYPCNLASAGSAQTWNFNSSGQLVNGGGGCADDADSSTGLSGGLGLVLNNCSGAATQTWTAPVYGAAPQVGFTGGDVSISINDGGLDPATVQQAISTLIPQGDNLPAGSPRSTPSSRRASASSGPPCNRQDSSRQVFPRRPACPTNRSRSAAAPSPSPSPRPTSSLSACRRDGPGGPALRAPGAAGALPVPSACPSPADPPAAAQSTTWMPQPGRQDDLGATTTSLLCPRAQTRPPPSTGSLQTSRTQVTSTR